MIYFAKDGSYGDACGLIIVDTSKWTPELLDLLNIDNITAVTVLEIDKYARGIRDDGSELVESLLDFCSL